jgi:hypothetical protein
MATYTYRESRNIEASTIEFIEHILEENDYTDVRIEKTFSRVYDLPDLPVICVRVGDTEHTKVEVGSNTTIRKPLILLDIFTDNDGQRLDLKDLLLDKIKYGWDYVEFIIENGSITSRIRNGKIQVLEVSDIPVDLGIEKSQLDKHDRYRHFIQISAQLSALES